MSERLTRAGWALLRSQGLGSFFRPGKTEADKITSAVKANSILRGCPVMMLAKVVLNVSMGIVSPNCVVVAYVHIVTCSHNKFQKKMNQYRPPFSVNTKTTGC